MIPSTPNDSTTDILNNKNIIIDNNFSTEQITELDIIKDENIADTLSNVNIGEMLKLFNNLNIN